MSVECPLITCIHNAKDRGEKGLCLLVHIELKWRFAANMGPGNIVCVECLYMELPGERK